MGVVDLSKYQNHLGFKHKLTRFLWGIVWILLARPFPRRVFNGWKVFLLRLFGAKIHSTAIVYSTAKIYYPPNLIMGPYSCIDSNVNCYNVDLIEICDNTTISQGTFLCTASHDITRKDHPLIHKPIKIKSQAWIAAEVFIGMGVIVGEGAVVGARSSVFNNVEPWTVVGGNPAKFIKHRLIKNE